MPLHALVTLAGNFFGFWFVCVIGSLIVATPFIVVGRWVREADEVRRRYALQRRSSRNITRP